MVIMMNEDFNFDQAMMIYRLIDSSRFKEIACYFNDFFRGRYAILKKLFESRHKVTAGDLAKDIGVSTARIAVALNKLEKDGLIQRFKSSDDGRIIIVKITENGSKYFLEHQRSFIRSVLHLLNKLDQNEIEVLKKILKIVIAERCE